MVDKHCEICGTANTITFHHLIPRTCHRNKWFKKQFTKDEMQTRGINVCRKCHSFIHKTFSEKELGRNFNTLEKILENEVIQKYRKWAVKKNN